MIRKYLPHAFILTGIVIIGIALFQNFTTAYYQKKLVEEYTRQIYSLNFDEIKVEEYENDPLNELPDEINEESIQFEKANEESPIDKYLEGKEISGIIEIPKLNVRAAILEGTDDRALKYTVGHYPGTANPGEKGNYVLLGHRNYVYGHYFRRINELELGDEVIIKKDTYEYTYIVTESFVVDPEDVWVLDSTEDTMLTMITCTPMLTYTDRLIVRGIMLE